MALWRVRYNGFEFRIMTFEKEELQQIQFSLIENQIKQAGDQAKALRYPAIVYLFFGFPLAEAAIAPDEVAEALTKVNISPQ